MTREALESATSPPRWAVWLAWGAVLSVVPSGVWRVLVGFGVDLGWNDAQLREQHIPGSGTAALWPVLLLAVTIDFWRRHRTGRARTHTG